MLYSFSDRDRSASVTLAESSTVCFSTGKWASVAVNTHGAIARGLSRDTLPGKYAFAVRVLTVDAAAGCAIGFVDAARFDFKAGVLGAEPGSWAYSKTGKVAAGSSPGIWSEYGESYGVGDVITAELHPASGRIRFLKNGVHQGTAFLEPELAGTL